MLCDSISLRVGQQNNVVKVTHIIKKRNIIKKRTYTTLKSVTTFLFQVIYNLKIGKDI